MHQSSLQKLAIAGAALVSVGSTTNASLTYDLRATAKNGSPLDISQAKSVQGLVPGDTVTFTIYAQVTGAAAGAEGFQTGFFSLLAPTAGGVLGNWDTGIVLPAFATGAFNGGTPTDTNADGLMDRLGGQRTTTAQSTAPFDIIVRAGSLPTYTGTPILNGQEFTLATATFHVTGGASSLFSIAASSIVGGIGDARFSSFWSEDAATTSDAANKKGGSSVAANNTGTLNTGPGVLLVSVPEPSAFGMVVLGAMGLVGFRRFGLRRA
jgi:hypothetical protein